MLHIYIFVNHKTQDVLVMFHIIKNTKIVVCCQLNERDKALLNVKLLSAEIGTETGFS